MSAAPGRVAKWWWDRPLRAKGLTVLAPPVMVLVITVAASFIAERYQVALRQATVAASASANQSATVLTLLLDAETGVRGYAISHDASFLVPYQMAVSDLPAQLATLSGDASGGASARDAAAVATLAKQKLAGLARIETGVASNRLSSQALVAELTAGKQVMDGLRARLGAIQAREADALAAKRHSVDRLQTAVQVIELAGLVVGVLGGFTAMVLFVRAIVRRVGEVGDNARRLGVSEPLAPMPAAGDEIGQLAQELRATSTLLTQRSSDLVRTHEAAVQAAAAADDLLARISHELRTPLTAVMGFGRLIEMSELNEEDAEAVGQILHAGEHMLRIIEETRSLDHRARAIDLDVGLVEVDAIVRDVLLLLAPLGAGRHLTMTGCRGPVVAVMADYHRFKQVLINLVSNAVKYNREGGTVAVACGSAADGRVRVAVTDTGEGIPSELLHRVFVPFDRLDAAARGVEGTGIGLSLSKAFVEAMDGTIGVESRVGRGSTFWVELPGAPPYALGAVRDGSV